MTSSRSALPRDARSLRRMLADKDTLLAERERIIAEKEPLLAERERAIAVRDAELYAKTIQIEHLKAQRWLTPSFATRIVSHSPFLSAER